jgi:hypothetical protein
MTNPTIYWASHVSPNNFAERALFNLEPTRLISDLSSIYNKESKYFSCPAFTDKYKNTFVLRFPFDVNISTFGNTEFITESRFVSKRDNPVYVNGTTFDYGFDHIYYSFEDQLLETSPPYLHQTSYSQFGHAASGAFNIHRWFRPSSPNISLYPNVPVFKASANEPLLYLNFPNSKTVTLKRFMVSDLLMNITQDSIRHKDYFPKQSLDSLYKRFTKGNLSKVIQKEILNNLLED